MTITNDLPPTEPTGTEVAARAVNAVKTYGAGETAVTALRGVSCEFTSGQFTAIMGPSGSGKSTLMHCLAGLDALSDGKVFVEGVDLTELSEKDLTKLRRDRIGFVFQAFNLIPTLNAEENILLPISLAGGDVDKSWFDEVVTTVGLRDRLSHRPSELSGGQQQRVAVARALASRPAVIFADEPTGNLDSKSSTSILEFMREAVDKHGQTIVMVTHDPFSASYADRVLVLADGNIEHEMTDPTVDSVVDFMRTFGD